MSSVWSLGILAGGESRRMGRDKADLQLDGRTLLEHLVQRLAPGAMIPVLVGTRPGGPGEGGPYPCVHDVIPGAGPLSSLTALLAACRTDYLLAVPCDMPLLPADLAQRMVARVGKGRALLFQAMGRLQPFPVLLARAAAPNLRAAFDVGERSALGWLAHCKAEVADWSREFPEVPAEHAFLNANDPASLAAVATALASSRRVAGDRG